MTSITEEVFRHRSEVRQILAWRAEDRNKALAYLAKVPDKRRATLEKDAREQWHRGNRGKWGDWRGV